MFYEMQIAGLTRQLPLCPLGDSMMIAGFVMFGDVEITVKCAEELLKRAPEFDVIVTAESKGIPLAHEMARQSGKDYVVLRKEPKLYMTNVVKTGVESITTAHIQTLCLGDYERNMIQGGRTGVSYFFNKANDLCSCRFRSGKSRIFALSHHKLMSYTNITPCRINFSAVYYRPYCIIIGFYLCFRKIISDL